MTNKIPWEDFSGKMADYMGLEKSEIRPELNIYSDLGMDSLGLFSFGMYLLNTYRVNVPVAAVATIETVGNIFELMNKHA
jgi:acyl carrier protein